MSTQRLGETCWGEMPKINSEIFTLTYGALVMQMVRDCSSISDVNKKLDKAGYNIGIRIIDEFLAKSGVRDCSNLKQTAEVIAKVAFKMFLGVTTSAEDWSSDGNAFSLIIGDNPLTDFVELPTKYRDVRYSNILCGIIRGALEMVQLQVECNFVRDKLRGDEINEIRVELKGMLEQSMADDYHD